MKRSRFSEEQIIGILKEQEAGAPTAEVHAAKLKAMGPGSPPVPGSNPGPIAQTAPDGVTSAKALLSAG